MPDRRSAADPRSRPIIRDSGEQPRAYPDDYGVASRHQPQPEPTADDAAVVDPAGYDDAAVVDPAGYDDADPAGYDPDPAAYQADGVYAEPFVEHDQPAQAVAVGYTEQGDTVYAHEVGYTPDGEPVYAEEMYTEHGEPVLAEQIIGDPADADQIAGAVYAEDDHLAVLPGHAGGGPPRHRGRRRVEREHHPVLLALGVLLVVIVLIGGVLIWWAKDQIDPGGKPGPAVTVVIPSGSSSKDIGKILARQGVIHSATLFPYYVKVQGGGTLYPGKYQMPKNESYGTAVHILEAGPQIVEDRLTIPEGYTLEQIATAIGRLPNVHVERGLVPRRHPKREGDLAVRAARIPQPGRAGLPGHLRGEEHRQRGCHPAADGRRLRPERQPGRSDRRGGQARAHPLPGRGGGLDGGEGSQA